MIQYHLIESWERSSRTLSGVRASPCQQPLAGRATRLQAGDLVCRGLQPLSILSFRVIVVGLRVGCFNFF